MKKRDARRSDAFTGKLAASVLKRVTNAVRGQSQTPHKSSQAQEYKIPSNDAFTNRNITTNLEITQTQSMLYNSTSKRYIGTDAVSALRKFENEEISFSIKAKVQTANKNIDVNLKT